MQRNVKSSRFLGMPFFGKSFGKAFIAMEVLGFFASYLIYREVNRNPDVRYELSRSTMFEPLLSTYYKLGDFMDKSNNAREADKNLWKSQGKTVD